MFIFLFRYKFVSLFKMKYSNEKYNHLIFIFNNKSLQTKTDENLMSLKYELSQSLNLLKKWKIIRIQMKKLK
jgi:hypothetical protein